MKFIRDYGLAKNAIKNGEPCLFAPYKDNLYQLIKQNHHENHIIGRKYKGIFDEDDGSYVTLTNYYTGGSKIDRDSYGSIPLYYSTNHPIVTTDMRLIIEVEKPNLDLSALCEYLSAAYITGGRTIYKNVRSLLPNQILILRDGRLDTEIKHIFPPPILENEEEISALLEQALHNSIHDLLQRFPGEMLLNLSGGTDSTLLLSKIKEIEPHKKIISTTYFHEDWRSDLNDWEYAEHASQHYGSKHHLIKINNASFTQGHSNLVKKANNIFHTYAAAFYLQNQLVQTLEDGAPIINGSGPDESIIGTEKITIQELMSLNSLPQSEWETYLIKNIDYIKIAEETATGMLHGNANGFTQIRKNMAADLLDAPNFVEFQRRYHAITILQDHIHELNCVAQVLGHPIIFPYLTNDIFRILFSAKFEALNANGIYKSAVKKILEKYMPNEFVHRKKIGFQSPSRPYFKSSTGLGLELTKLLTEKKSACLNLELIKNEIKERLSASLDLYRRYDFLEWTTYNILFLEKLRGKQCLNP